VTLQVIGYETVGHRGYTDELRRLALQLGVYGRVKLQDQVPTRIELLTLCGRCDVGIALVPTSTRDLNEQHMVGASNKPFDYLSQGLALLVTDRQDWRQAYVDPGYALACQPENPASVAKALRWFLEHPSEMRAMGERGRTRIIREWNYEAQFERVYQSVSIR